MNIDVRSKEKSVIPMILALGNVSASLQASSVKETGIASKAEPTETWKMSPKFKLHHQRPQDVIEDFSGLVGNGSNSVEITAYPFLSGGFDFNFFFHGSD